MRGIAVAGVALAGVVSPAHGPVRPLAVTTIAPLAAPAGATLAITGVSLSGVQLVRFAGAVSAIPASRSPTRITVVIPNGARSGSVSVLSDAGSAASRMPLTVTFSVTGLLPNAAPPGAPVVIAGAGFRAAARVTFGGVSASQFHVDSPNYITAVVPPGARTGPVTVFTSSRGTSSGAQVFEPVDLLPATYDVSTTDDVVNGDTSSLEALVSKPGIDGISLNEAVTALDNTGGTDPVTISFAPSLAGSAIVFAGPFPVPPITRSHASIDGLTDGDGAPTITLDSRNVSITIGSLFVRASHVSIEHLKFVNTMHNATLNVGAGDAIGFPSAPASTTDVLIDGNVFSNLGNDDAHTRAINIGLSSIASGSTVSDVRITNNTFVRYRNDDTLAIGGAGTGNTVDGVTVSGNSFTDTELAIEMALSGAASDTIQNTTIVDNVFTNDRQPLSMLVIDNGSTPSTSDLITGTDIERNTFVGTTNPAIAVDGGIGNTTGSSVTDTTVADDLFVGGDGVFATGGADGASGNAVTGITLASDTFASTSHGLFLASGDAGNGAGEGSVINTIFDSVGVGVSGSTTVPVSYSLFHGTCAFTGSDGNLCADPDFVSPGTGDYHLKAGSPAIDAGTSDGAPGVDRDCRGRVNEPDIGAYEYGGAVGDCSVSP